MTKKILAFAADHGGFNLKNILIEHATSLGWECIDHGTYSEESVDYPAMAEKVVQALKQQEASFGVLLCGSGIGISIAANRHHNIRAALCHFGLHAKLAREHNNANILCLGGRIIGPDLAKECLEIFLNTPFSAAERHVKRVNMLN